MSREDVFLRIRAVTHSVDTLLSYGDDGAVNREDVIVLVQLLAELVDSYDQLK